MDTFEPGNVVLYTDEDKNTRRQKVRLRKL